MIPFDARQWWIVFVTFLVVSGLLFFVLVNAIGQTVPPLQSSSFDNRLDALDRLAVEEAYRKHVMAMFESLMKDPVGQPFRSLAGHRNARQAYIDMMTAIDQRPK